MSRNLAKRRIRELFRVNKGRIGSLDLVVVARARITVSPWSEVNGAFLQALSRLQSRLDAGRAE